MTPQGWTKEQRQHYCKDLLAKRQRARTDLFYLANEVLAPSDSKILVPHAHGAIVDHCQKFKGYVEAMHPDTLKIIASQPICSMWDLEGPRNGLLLVSRGHLKTTIHTVAHGIQWILNYPDVRMLVCTAIGEQGERMLNEMRSHFQFNQKLRFLFPESCPPAKKAAEFGSMSEFTVPNRVRKAKEPTVMLASIGKVLASTHHDVMKCSDVVSEANTKTKGQIQEAKDFFGYVESLRERGPSKDGKSNVGWKDVEGTIYDFADYYSMILDHEEKLPPEKRQWHITKRSCWVDKEKRIPLWPERFPAAELDRILNSPEVGPYIFSSQYELNPVPPGTGLATIEQIQYFPARFVKENMARYSVSTTIDLATLDGSNTDGDYCAMVTAGFQRDGRLDIFSIQNGRFTDEKLVELMFLTQAVYPTNREFRIQKDQISSGFKTFLRREMTIRKQWLNVSYPPIATNESKTNRIIRNLRGWFALGLIRFADNITCKTELVNQIIRFPRAANDDILDALADQMHNAKGEPVSDAIPNERAEMERKMDNGWLPPMDPYRSHVEPEMTSYYAEVTGI